MCTPYAYKHITIACTPRYAVTTGTLVLTGF